MVITHERSRHIFRSHSAGGDSRVIRSHMSKRNNLHWKKVFTLTIELYLQNNTDKPFS